MELAWRIDAMLELVKEGQDLMRWIKGESNTSYRPDSPPAFDPLKIICQRTPLGRLLGIYPIYCLYFIFILSSLHICLSLFGYHLILSSCQHYTPYLIITGIPLLLLAVCYLA